MRQLQQLVAVYVVCSRLQQDFHEHSSASANAEQESEYKDSQLEGLRRQNQRLSDSNVCCHIILLSCTFHFQSVHQ